MKTFPVLFLFVVFFAACASERVSELFRDLDSSVTEYNDLLRANEFDKAKSFVDESKRDEFEARAKAAPGLKVVGYNILRRDYQVGKGEETVDVEFRYTIPASAQVKTLIDEQKWLFVYVKEEKRKRWRLVSLLPEFK